MDRLDLMDSAEFKPTLRSFDEKKPLLSHWTLNLLSLFWFANQLEWTALLVILIPHQVTHLSTNETKGQTLSTILFFGSFLSCLTFPIFGALSDSSELSILRRWGKRKPFVAIGAVGSTIGLLGLGVAGQESLPVFLGFFLITRFFGDLAAAPYSGVIPDLVPPAQYGTASGWIGVHSLLGSLFGGLFGFTLRLGIFYNYLLICLFVLVGSSLSVLFLPDIETKKDDDDEFLHYSSLSNSIDEEKAPSILKSNGTWDDCHQKISLFGSPFRYRNFQWIFFTRFLMVLGGSLFQQFLQYYFRDVVSSPFHFFFGVTLQTAEEATSVFVTAVLFSAVPLTLLAGIYADHSAQDTKTKTSTDPLMKKKKIVCAAGVLQGIAGFLVLLFPSASAMALIGLVWGMGYGSFASVDWALATAILPSKSSAARDLGVWHLASTIPQMGSAAVAGPVVDYFQQLGHESANKNLGYIIVYGLGTILFCLASCLVFMIQPDSTMVETKDRQLKPMQNDEFTSDQSE
eukprot:TRINITY_DN439_c0_g1_i1.p1 TRINITY_DN439_c0_g1~~TRINITY_DN439_c0_g1_i1.p1  ORF type:complete len:528 (-),score=92.77 TRINITY_DN439_c0_g1_i1:1519-3063(-)